MCAQFSVRSVPVIRRSSFSLVQTGFFLSFVLVSCTNTERVLPWTERGVENLELVISDYHVFLTVPFSGDTSA